MSAAFKAMNGITNVKDSQEGGWDFWSRVYNDRELRNAIEETQAETPLSELLQSDSLCRAELVVGNVPRLSISQTAVVKLIIQKDLQCNVQILNIEIQTRKWVIKFYRLKDAQRVQRKMDGHFFRGKSLKASVTEIISDEPEVEVSSVPVPAADNRSLCWTSLEWKDLQQFKAEALEIMKKHADGISIPDLLNEIGSAKRCGVVSAILENWPTAAFRMMAPEVKMTGRYLSLLERYNMADLMKRVLSEGGSLIELERWESSFPFEIRNDANLVEYAAALLSHFGPQHLDIDVPFRFLCSTLNPEWSSDSRELGSKLVCLSAQFIIFGDVLYLATNVRHRRLLLEFVQPTAVVMRRSRYKRSRRSQ